MSTSLSVCKYEINKIVYKINAKAAMHKVNVLLQNSDEKL